ncbi:MAG: hypothetical protein H8E10_17700 [Desulfobacterales bacterium]|nr:hypothetical protein [Desulfobacterales bacterium]MBL7172096.1 hypothetical protein [Desulfobacteraceae bacterium]MBL7205382.1 hypothetical protein [Desulfobacteraceae bacterium]
MDADCLIKLTKAGLKEFIANEYSIFIPGVVKREVVDAGKAKQCPDAFAVENNINANVLTIVEASSDYPKGDEALIALFRKEAYDTVATDDLKLIRRLKIGSIPFILPGLIIYQLLENKIINRQTAIEALNKLSEFISGDEFSVVRLLMEKKNESKIDAHSRRYRSSH